MFQGRVPERSEHLPATWGRIVFRTRNTTTEVFRRAVGPSMSTFCGVKQTTTGRVNVPGQVFRNVPNTMGQNVCRERSERYRFGRCSGQ